MAHLTTILAGGALAFTGAANPLDQTGGAGSVLRFPFAVPAANRFSPRRPA